MVNDSKTQKIGRRFHQALKRYAAETDRTLQDVTEEILADGMEKRGIRIAADDDGKHGNRGNQGDDNQN